MRRGRALSTCATPTSAHSGMAEGAIGVDRAALEANPGEHLPDRDAEILLICQSGQRSHARRGGIGRARATAIWHPSTGGTSAWQAAGLPMVRDRR